MAAKEREKMNFTAFQKQVAGKMRERLGTEVRVEPNRIIKNNGVVWNGLTVSREGSNIAPTIYLDELYKEYCDGRTLRSIVGQVMRVYEKSCIKGSVCMDFFRDYEQVRGKIVYRLVNYRRNKKQLAKMPHICFLDMAVIFACTMMNDQMTNASILISNDHCTMWDVDTDRLLEEAVKNTPRYHRVCVRDMEEVIRDMFEEQLQEEVENFCSKKLWDGSRQEADEWADKMRRELEEELERERGRTSMYVMGSISKQYGAGTILYPGVLMEFAQEKERNFFILPCSVHEVILVPDGGRESAERLQLMVREVNETQLEEEDILSDSVYYFDRSTGKVTLLCGEETEQSARN